MRLPVRTFWRLVRDIERIRADEDMRQFALLQNLLGGDPKSYWQGLLNEKGKAVEGRVEAEFDRAGFDRLKNLMTGRRG